MGDLVKTTREIEEQNKRKLKALNGVVSLCNPRTVSYNRSSRGIKIPFNNILGLTMK